MVYLSKIYTKSGDTGETGLGDGDRVSKNHPRVIAYGTVDELNAVLGLSLAQGLTGAENENLASAIRDVQNDLFDLGADLCVPETDQRAGSVSDRRTESVSGRSKSSTKSETPPLRVRAEQVTRLEKLIDGYNAELQPLTSFVLPGGTPASAWFHFARTVCRRAERDVVTLSISEKINPQIVIYLNRLSDLLFVLARVCNDKGSNDILWAPGKSQ